MFFLFKDVFLVSLFHKNYVKQNGAYRFQGIEMQSVGRFYCFILLSTI